jgi:hypothetical protein
MATQETWEVDPMGWAGLLTSSWPSNSLLTLCYWGYWGYWV